MEQKKYCGVFPALYACYEPDGSVSHARAAALASRNETAELCMGSVSRARTAALAEYLLARGVTGLYVGGSSGECIYQSVDERRATLEAVMEAVGGRMTVIAHVACNNTADSRALARHAQALGVDAVAAIPPIYFHLPERAVAAYWNAISDAAPNTDFIIYNIPQLAGTALTLPLLREMKKNPRVIGVKNSSMPVQDIQMFRSEGVLVFNGPDEQFVSGLAAGACGGIGGTYAAMPELFLAARRRFLAGDHAGALALQDEICAAIYLMCTAQGNLYAVLKEVVRLRGGPDIGSVRAPLLPLAEGDHAIAAAAAARIDAAVSRLAAQ